MVGKLPTECCRELSLLRSAGATQPALDGGLSRMGRRKSASKLAGNSRSGLQRRIHGAVDCAAARFAAAP